MKWKIRIARVRGIVLGMESVLSVKSIIRGVEIKLSAVNNVSSLAYFSKRYCGRGCRVEWIGDYDGYPWGDLD